MSRLQGLPAEIRNRIYELVLYVPTDTGKVTLINRRGWRTPPSGPSVLALRKTCRQIRAETEGIFYHVNHVQLDPHFKFGAKLPAFEMFMEDMVAKWGEVKALTLDISIFYYRVYDVGLASSLYNLTTLHLKLDDVPAQVITPPASGGELDKLCRCVAKFHKLKELRLLAPPNFKTEKCRQQLEAVLQQSIKQPQKCTSTSESQRSTLQE